MKLDFSKINKKTNQEDNISVASQVDPTTQTGLRLTLTEGKTYNLDEMITTKMRDNSNETLILRNISDTHFRDRMIELVTKKILDDYNVEWDEENYNSAVTIAKVNNFSKIFDIYFNRYYEEYRKVITSGEYEGSLSIDTILRTINLTKEDIKRYTLGDVDEHQNEFLNYHDRNRPIVIWTDGSSDDGSGDNGKSLEILKNKVELLNRFLFNKIIIEDENIGFIIGSSEVKYGYLTVPSVATDNNHILIYQKG